MTTLTYTLPGIQATIRAVHAAFLSAPSETLTC